MMKLMKNLMKHNTAIVSTFDNTADEWDISEAEVAIERNANAMLNSIRADRFDRECEEGAEW